MLVLRKVESHCMIGSLINSYQGQQEKNPSEMIKLFAFYEYLRLLLPYFVNLLIINSQLETRSCLYFGKFESYH